jgi:hypothetical protein
MADEQKISVRAYSRMIGVSDTSIRKAIKAKKIVKGFDPVSGEIIPSIADKEYGNAIKAATVKPGETVIKSIEKIKAKKSSIKTEKPTVYDEYGEDIDQPVFDPNAPLTTETPVENILVLDTYYKAKLNKMKMEQMEGTLVLRAEVDKEAFALGVEIKKALQNIPARIAALVRATDSDAAAEMMIRDEVNGALLVLSQIKTITIDAD